MTEQEPLTPQKEDATHRKKRGGFYTPSAVCEFMVKWVMTFKPRTVLEPSCGEGRFLSALASVAGQCEGLSVTAIEQDADEAEKARGAAKGLPGAEIITGGFFRHYLERIDGKRTFDAIIGNPPYIRYQEFTGQDAQIAAALMKGHGTGLNRLTNAWIAFVALCADAVSRDGVLAMVLPAELVRAPGAERLRALLAGKFEQITVVLFRDRVFAGALQKTALLLARRRAPETERGLYVFFVKNAESLTDDRLERILCADHTRVPAEDLTRNWLAVTMGREQKAALSKLAQDPRVKSTTDLFEVNIGMTTGENRFFILTRERAIEFDIDSRDLRPILSKSAHLRGMVFRKDDYAQLLNDEAGVLLFDPEHNGAGCPSRAGARAYVADGEDRGMGLTFKCQQRKEGDMWHIPPHSWEPQAMMSKLVHAVPRIVLNPAGALATDSLLKLRFHDGVDGARVVAAFMNSYTLALAEMRGAPYSGGVLSLNPGTVRSLRIPMAGAEKLDIERFDRLYREGRIEQIIEETDRVLLEEGLGLSGEEITALRSIWKKFQSQRLNKLKEDTNDCED